AAEARLGGRVPDLAALAAATEAVAEPRVLGRAAIALAATGAVDGAERLVARALRLASPLMPALAWARVAIALGRGEPAAPPRGLAPAEPDTRLLAARAALAAGGPERLGRLLDSFGREAVAADPDLRALATLVPGAPAR